MEKPLAIDDVKSIRWAITEVVSANVEVLGAYAYELVNLDTLRAHQLQVTAFAIGRSPLPVGGSVDGGSLEHGSLPDYNYFTTRRPVCFEDFNGNGARVTGVNAGFYSISWLTVFDGPAYITNTLLYERFNSFGVGVPSADLGHGVTSIFYGSGNPAGGPMGYFPKIEPPTVEEIRDKLKITQQDDRIAIEIPGDLLFDFDKDVVKPAAVSRLKMAALLIQMSRRLKRVEIVGHTDAIGTAAHNQKLSERRARAVVEWLITFGGLRPSIIRTTTEGVGSTQPAAPNTLPNKADNPAGREKNRRVEIYLWFKPRNEPDTWSY
jgi:outer membrane protein OmpA-like peptidoglycan-associated protein